MDRKPPRPIGTECPHRRPHRHIPALRNRATLLSPRSGRLGWLEGGPRRVPSDTCCWCWRSRCSSPRAEALHAAATDIVRRLSDAEAAIADQVRDYDELSQLANLGPTPAFGTFIAVNDEATTICLAAQEMFDDTKRREILKEVPWLTSELKTVIEVVFDCVPGES